MSRPGKTPPGETNQWLGPFLRGRDTTIKIFAWFMALWYGAGACFLLWCAFCIGTGRWRSDRPVLDAALFLLGAVLCPLFAWFCIRVVLPRIRRDQDRLLEYIREHGGPRHALNVFLFGDPATNAPAASAPHADSADGAELQPLTLQVGSASLPVRRLRKADASPARTAGTGRTEPCKPLRNSR